MSVVPSPVSPQLCITQVDAEGFLTRSHVLETGNSLGEEDALNVALLRSDLETFLDGIEQEGCVIA